MRCALLMQGWLDWMGWVFPPIMQQRASEGAVAYRCRVGWLGQRTGDQRMRAKSEEGRGETMKGEGCGITSVSLRCFLVCGCMIWGHRLVREKRCVCLCV